MLNFEQGQSLKLFERTNSVLWFALSSAKTTAPPQFTIPNQGSATVSTFYAVCLDAFGLEISRYLLSATMIDYDAATDNFICDKTVYTSSQLERETISGGAVTATIDPGNADIITFSQANFTDNLAIGEVINITGEIQTEIGLIIDGETIQVSDELVNTGTPLNFTYTISKLKADAIYYFEITTADNLVYNSDAFNTFTDTYTASNTKLPSNGAVQWYSGIFDLKLFDLEQYPFAVPEIASYQLPSFSFTGNTGTGAISTFKINCIDTFGAIIGTAILDETQINLAGELYTCDGGTDAASILAETLYYFEATDGANTYFTQPFLTYDISNYYEYLTTETGEDISTEIDQLLITEGV